MLINDDRVKYEAMKRWVFAKATLPDGYSGHTIRVGIAFHEPSGRTYWVSDKGYFRAPIGECLSKEEAMFCIKGSMACRNVKRIRVFGQ